MTSDKLNTQLFCCALNALPLVGIKALVIDAAGVVTFDPNGAFEDLAVGVTRDTTLTYQISDGIGGFDTATVAITVTLVIAESDLSLTSFVVSPSTVTNRQFTSASFNLTNNGPVALSSEPLKVDYYLSTDTTFGNSDDPGDGTMAASAPVSAGADTLASKR